MAYTAAEVTERLACRAPHPDPRKPGRECGGPLGGSAEWEFVGLSKHLPTHGSFDPDWTFLYCPTCGVWNLYRWRVRLSA